MMALGKTYDGPGGRFVFDFADGTIVNVRWPLDRAVPVAQPWMSEHLVTGADLVRMLRYKQADFFAHAIVVDAKEGWRDQNPGQPPDSPIDHVQFYAD